MEYLPIKVNTLSLLKKKLKTLSIYHPDYLSQKLLSHSFYSAWCSLSDKKEIARGYVSLTCHLIRGIHASSVWPPHCLNLGKNLSKTRRVYTWRLWICYLVTILNWLAKAAKNREFQKENWGNIRGETENLW